ncbi:hypothetical protein FRX31_002021, partial [Thalictrum thalictroides]
MSNARNITARVLRESISQETTTQPPAATTHTNTSNAGIRQPFNQTLEQRLDPELLRSISLKMIKEQTENLLGPRVLVL